MFNLSVAPFILSFGLLLFWTGLGWALVSVLEPKMETLRALFLAPVVGVACTLLPVFWLNLFGMPVGLFSRYLAAVLFSFALFAWIRRRPSWTRSELIFFAPVLVSLFLIGLPMASFGFDWVGNANDDWANYNLSAIRYLSDGYYQEPSLEAMRIGSDYPGFLWFMEVAEDTRSGSELLLAWTSAVVGKNPFFIFMPLILAFHGVLCFAAASLAASSFKRRSVLFAVMLLMAIAPLNLYAIHQQLIAQVIGLAFMCATTCLTFVPFSEFRSRGRVALTAVVVAAYWLVYPETVPFFGLAFLLFHVTHIRNKDWGWKQSWAILIPPALTCVTLGPYAASFFFFLLKQMHGSITQGIFDGSSIFPYFSVPSGLAVLFGFSRLGELMSEPWLSLSIGASILLLLFVAIGTVFGVLQRKSIACYAVVICIVATTLVIQHNDFGVFKVAMFSQAFIWSSLVALLLRLTMIPGAVVYALVLFALVFTDAKYTQSSLADSVGGGNSIPGASREHLLTKVLTDGSKVGCDSNYETLNPSLIKLLGATRGCAKSFLARPMLFGAQAQAVLKNVKTNPLHRPLGIVDFTERSASELTPQTVNIRFPSLDGVPVVTMRPVVEFARTVNDAELDSIFDDQTDGIAGSKSGKHDGQLIFVNSNLGSHYYIPEFGVTGIFETERDTFSPQGKIAAVGRYLLFRIQSPANSPRLVLDVTSSILSDGIAKLPPAKIVAESPVPVGLEGRGAARVVSPPFSPVIVDGVSYVLLDFGVDGKFLNVPRSGLMSLYGTKVPLDYRRIVTFARQIRLASADDLKASDVPSKVAKFPEDLLNSKLQFSGIYEDGWIAEEGFLLLRSDATGKVVFRGTFPNGLGLDHVDISIQIEGGATVQKSLKPGAFTVEAPVAAGVSRVSFHFSAIGKLPGGDNRPAVALLSSVAMETGDVGPPVDLPAALRGDVVDASGVFADGWSAREGYLVVTAKEAGTATIRGMVPGGIGLEGQELVATNPAGETARKKITPGQFEVKIPVGPGRSKISWAFSKGADLPVGDGRNVGALLQSVVVTPDTH